MKREATCVTLTLLVAGAASLSIAVLVLAIAFLSVVYYPTDDGPILWDRVAGWVLPLLIIGAFLLWIGVRYRRSNA